jgi:hypothetical protein
MYDIIFTNNGLTTIASIITISYFTKDMIKYVFNLIRNYIVYLKKELINQMKELVIEVLGDKSNKVNDNKINDIFEDITPTKITLPTLKQDINDFLKDEPSLHPQYRVSSLSLNKPTFVSPWTTSSIIPNQSIQSTTNINNSTLPESINTSNYQEPYVHSTKLSNKSIGLLKKKRNNLNSNNDINSLDETILQNNFLNATNSIPIHDIRGEGIQQVIDYNNNVEIKSN